MPAYAIDGKAPAFEDADSNWIAPDATLIGDVRVGRNAGFWFGVVIRGDNEPIVIGADSNVQEHTVMHTDPGFPLTIGQGCTIGHRALLHGCTIGDNSLIGMGAIVLNGAQDRQELAGRRRRAGHRRQGIPGQFSDRRFARARRQSAGRRGGRKSARFGRALRRQWQAVQGGAEKSLTGRRKWWSRPGDWAGS